jgi:hypothetical protein
MRLNLFGAFVIAQSHLAFATIAASLASFAQVITASIFRAKNTNIARILAAD